MPRFRNPVVSTADIADGSITTSKIADAAVSTVKIANLAITTAKIDNLAVTDAKIGSLSASKITAGTINTGTITVGSELRMAGGASIKFSRNSSAIITTNHNPQNGDVWIEYRGNDAGAIIGQRRSSGVDLVVAQMNVSGNGFEIRQGQFLLEQLNTPLLPDLTWAGDPDSGLHWVTGGVWELVGNGNPVIRIAGSGTPRFDAPAVENLTTGAAATVNIGAHSNSQMRRSTSALKYKSRITRNVAYLADLELTPTKHWRRDDRRWRYGLIADWLADQDPLLGVFSADGEIEDYDTRAVLTVMAAKLARLEAALEL